MSKRTYQIIMTNEAKVLKQIRISKKLSIRDVAKLIGCSYSLIAHIENGRVNIPNKKRMLKILDAYQIQLNTFHRLVNSFKDESTDEEIVRHLIAKLNSDQMKFLRSIIEQMIRSN